MKKAIAVFLGSLVSLALFLSACNTDYNITLESVKEADLDALTNYSYELVSSTDGTGEVDRIGYTVAGDWVKVDVGNSADTVINLGEKRLYSLNEETQEAYYATVTEEELLNPKEAFLIYDSEIFDNVKWKLIGQETLDGNECEVYEGKGNFLDATSLTVYKLKDQNIYVKMTGEDSAGKEIVTVYIKNLKLSGVTEEEAGVPAGYTIEEGSLE